MEAIKKYKSQLIFHLVLNLFIGIFITFSSYYHLPLSGFYDHFSYALHFLILQFTVFGFTYLLSLNKHLFNFIFPPIFIICSLFAYWTYSQDITISKSIIQIVIESKIDIAIDLITIPFILYFLATLVALYIIIIKHNKLTIVRHKSLLLIIAIFAIIFFHIIENKRYGTLKRRLPYTLVFGTLEYLDKPSEELDNIEQPISHTNKDFSIVFILGESVRADHLQINGYQRKTTPLLTQTNNLISFSKIHTPLTYTAISVPQILTNKSIDSSLKDKHYSIYSVLNKLDITTSWIGNQTPENSFEEFINQNQNINIIDPQHSVLSFHKKLDEELIPKFKESFSNSKQQFTTLHMIGSHWWYENRYSNKFQKFKPVIDSKHIPSLSEDQMINSYDNTILYLDTFLNNIISILKHKESKTLLIYLSDHGELLGENGKWMHAQDGEASKNPAMLVWYSDSFKKDYPNLISNLKQHSSKKIPTDFFFHSILDLIGTKNLNYNKNQSIFNETSFR
jgi:glucan phosphoethanolaminetransferase (alkaline phosphatase superfamily)